MKNYHSFHAIHGREDIADRGPRIGGRPPFNCYKAQLHDGWLTRKMSAGIEETTLGERDRVKSPKRIFMTNPMFMGS